MLMLTLDDAVKVTWQLLIDQIYDEDIIYQELMQKCWLPSVYDAPKKALKDLISDINPAEICSQIQSDNLRNWCEAIQAEMIMAIAQQDGGQNGRNN